MAIFRAPRGDPNHASLACFWLPWIHSLKLAKRREQWSRGTAGDQRTHRHQLRLACGREYGFASQDGVHGDGRYCESGLRLEGANKFYDTMILLGPRTYELAPGH
jgi:hypothetical protein